MSIESSYTNYNYIVSINYYQILNLLCYHIFQRDQQPQNPQTLCIEETKIESPTTPKSTSNKSTLTSPKMTTSSLKINGVRKRRTTCSTKENKTTSSIKEKTTCTKEKTTSTKDSKVANSKDNKTTCNSKEKTNIVFIEERKILLIPTNSDAESSAAEVLKKVKKSQNESEVIVENDGPQESLRDIANAIVAKSYDSQDDGYVEI